MRLWSATGTLAAIAASLALAEPAQSLTFGEPVRLSSVGADGDTSRGTGLASIAYAPVSGGRFLVAYRADGGTTDNEYEIWFRLIGPSGGPLGPDTRLSFAGTEGGTQAEANFASVAYNALSNEFMVAWQETDTEPTEDEIEVFFARVSADGVPVDLNGGAAGYGIRISDTSPAFLDFSGDPSITVNQATGEALVAFTDLRPGGDANHDIAVQRLSAAGAEIPGTADSIISEVTTLGWSGAPAATYNAALDQYGVAWDQATGGGYFQALTPSGGQVPPNDVSYFPPVLHAGPAIAPAGPAGWQIAAQTAAGQVGVIRANAAGVPTASQLALTGSGSIAALAADTLGGGFLVTGTGVGPPARELGADGAPVDAQVPAGLGGGVQATSPAIAFDSTARRWLLAATVLPAGGEFEVYGAFSGAGATPPGPVPTPASPTPSAAPPPAAPAAKPKAVSFSSVTTLPSTKACVSRRAFRIRIREPAGVDVVDARVFVNGKRVKVVKSVRRTATVDLRGLPKGRFKVKIEVRTADDRKVSGTRTYRTCAPKRRSGPGRPKV